MVWWRGGVAAVEAVEPVESAPAPSRALPRPRVRSQVFLSYGALPNLALLSQFGFVLPASATDFALVHCDELAHAGGATAAAVGAAAEPVGTEPWARPLGGEPSAWAAIPASWPASTADAERKLGAAASGSSSPSRALVSADARARGVDDWFGMPAFGDVSGPSSMHSSGLCAGSPVGHRPDSKIDYAGTLASMPTLLRSDSFSSSYSSAASSADSLPGMDLVREFGDSCRQTIEDLRAALAAGKSCSSTLHSLSGRYVCMYACMYVDHVLIHRGSRAAGGSMSRGVASQWHPSYTAAGARWLARVGFHATQPSTRRAVSPSEFPT